jgi:predicted phosphodiesterase
MPLLVLQLSDIHFTTHRDDERVFHDDVRRELLADLRVLQHQLGRPVEAIAITGDIAFSGKRTEYQLAGQWLDQVIDACRCSHTAVLTVPGNHDVDRDRIRMSAKIVHRGLRSASVPQAQMELTSLASNRDPLLLDKLHEYQSFAACYGTPFSSSTNPNWVRRFQLSQDCAIHFVGLSTVQVCDGNDERGGMFLGSHQYVVERTPNVEQIVLMHHPLEWLKDRGEAENYLSSRAKVLIYGHEHLQQLQGIQDATGYERLILSSGAVTPEHATDPYIYRYNLLSFDHSITDGMHSLVVTVYPRVWGRQATAFQPDWSALNGQESRTFALRSTQFGQPPLSATAQRAATAVQPLDIAVPCSSAALLRHLFWRHLEWRTRMDLLIRVSGLPSAPEAPLPQDVEVAALAQAEARNKLRELWTLVMEHVPVDARTDNPFTER